MKTINPTPFKVSIKKLPPELPIGDFLKTIDNYISQIKYYYMMPGKATNKSKLFTSVYLIFDSEESARMFLSSYDHKFIDQKGLAYKPVLEPAIFQYYVEKENITKNNVENSYLTDSYFQNFIKKLRSPVLASPQNTSNLDRKPGQIIEEKTKKFEKTKTPIIEEIEKNREVERKKKEEKKREEKDNERKRTIKIGNKTRTEIEPSGKKKNDFYKKKHSKQQAQVIYVEKK